MRPRANPLPKHKTIRHLPESGKCKQAAAACCSMQYGKLPCKKTRWRDRDRKGQLCPWGFIYYTLVIDFGNANANLHRDLLPLLRNEIGARTLRQGCAHIIVHYPRYIIQMWKESVEETKNKNKKEGKVRKKNRNGNGLEVVTGKKVVGKSIKQKNWAGKIRVNRQLYMRCYC
ncbi:uncharacterized protein EI90DRAFT_2432721 [Cantharellus anzutake]|uniref:uncharacterized protein n=1 Tax=Cantharellus anzutake TaxID=1750568 RepID=UPI001908FB19|nr:uncharacterized protein EI90DRAFT_2432721 [Cantharellus anzutake]KAF8338950.1 hypothetical protein EI90DRAFT_2432721 [Cantharellus anzutake]